MAYTVYDTRKQYGPRRGLEGPFIYPNGRVCYYDPKEGKYWCPQSDIYLTDDEALDLQAVVFDRLRGKPQA